MRLTHRIGIIGAGPFSDLSVGAYAQYLDNFELVAVCDHNPSVAQEFATKHKINHVYQTSDQLLADKNIELVLILTPPNTHYQLAKAALMAGKHALVEKPIALSEAEARELVDLADQHGQQLSTNLVLRYHPFHQEIRRMVREKTYGALQQISTNAYLAEYPKEHWYWDESVSGGFFLNTYCHFLDLYSYFFGQPAKQLHSTGNDRTGQLIVSDFQGQLASLSINLHASGEQESVETTYIFEQALVKTNGWLPEHLSVTTRDGQLSEKRIDDKIGLYQRLLAEVLADLLTRIEQPSTKTKITHHDLLQAVSQPLAAAKNRF